MTWNELLVGDVEQALGIRTAFDLQMAADGIEPCILWSKLSARLRRAAHAE
jgi:hypothetical protein